MNTFKSGGGPIPVGRPNLRIPSAGDNLIATLWEVAQTGVDVTFTVLNIDKGNGVIDQNLCVRLQDTIPYPGENGEKKNRQTSAVVDMGRLNLMAAEKAVPITEIVRNYAVLLLKERANNPIEQGAVPEELKVRRLAAVEDQVSD